MGIATPLRKGTWKEHGRFTFMAFEIWAQVHTGPTPNTKVIINDVFQQFIRSKDWHHTKPSLPVFHSDRIAGTNTPSRPATEGFGMVMGQLHKTGGDLPE